MIHIGLSSSLGAPLNMIGIREGNLEKMISRKKIALIVTI